MRVVYAICCEDGRAYVGSTAHIIQRRVNHRHLLRQGKHPNRPMQEAWDVYGEQAFAFVVLEVDPDGDLFAAEQRWIERFRTAECAFNVAPFAASLLGKKATPEGRANMSAAQAGENNPQSRLTAVAVQDIRRRAALGEKQVRIAERYAIAPATVWKIVKGKSWSHILDVKEAA